MEIVGVDDAQIIAVADYVELVVSIVHPRRIPPEGQRGVGDTGRRMLPPALSVRQAPLDMPLSVGLLPAPTGTAIQRWGAGISGRSCVTFFMIRLTGAVKSSVSELL